MTPVYVVQVQFFYYPNSSRFSAHKHILGVFSTATLAEEAVDSYRETLRVRAEITISQIPLDTLQDILDMHTAQGY